MTEIVRMSELNPKRVHGFELKPQAEALQALAQALGITSVRKLRFKGTLSAQGQSDWKLDGHLGATVTQPCVVTLAPVTTRIEEPVQRLFLADWVEPEDAEVEMDGDDTSEPLPATLDLAAVAEEALALALPPYPRAQGAELGKMVVTEPGLAPMDDEAAKPFAGLADLKKKLEGGPH